MSDCYAGSIGYTSLSLSLSLSLMHVNHLPLHSVLTMHTFTPTHSLSCLVIYHSHFELIINLTN